MYDVSQKKIENPTLRNTNYYDQEYHTMADHYLLCGKNLKYLESVCEIKKHELYIVARYHNKLFALYKCEKDLLICWDPYSSLDILLNIMKLFHMKSIIKLEGPVFKWIINRNDCRTPFSFSYKMDLALITNKFYCMVFALALTRSTEQVEKFIFDAIEKYKLLKQTDCLPLELSVEISTYLIEFILMCMM